MVQRQSSRLDIGFIRSVVVEFRNVEEHSDHQVTPENVWECNLQKCKCNATCQMILGVIDLNHTRKHGFVHFFGPQTLWQAG